MREDLINKLKGKIKSRSVNSLGNIDPDTFVDWLGVSQQEARDLIQVLHDQRIALFKYKVKCACGEICTVYVHKLLHDKVFYCEVCGKSFSVDDIKMRGEIIYEIDKKEYLNWGKEQVDFKILPDRKDKVVSIRRIQEKEGMEIFLGSSVEAVNYMEEIAAKLEELDVTPLLWKSPGKGIFIPGTNTIDALLAITKRTQAAIFIFNEDDKIWNEKSALEATNSVRDNVLFEYGLFMGALGKEKVCFVCKGKPKIATDLKGITYIDGDKGDNYVKLKLKDWVSAIKNKDL